MFSVSCIALLAVAMVGDLVSAGPASREPPPPPIKGLGVMLHCGVCTEIVRHSNTAIREKRRALPVGVKLKEDDVMDYVDKLCDVKRDEGGWIRTSDIVFGEGKFALRKMTSWGKCTRECSTLQQVCRDVLRDSEVDTLAELLYKNKTRAVLQKTMCDSACRGQGYQTLPPMALQQIAGELEAFEEISSKEREVELTVGRMDGVEGAPGMDVYSRAEMDKMGKAMDEGDYDTWRDLDDTAADMDDEQLEMMRKMQKGERPPPEDHEQDEDEPPSPPPPPKQNKKPSKAAKSEGWWGKAKSFFGF